jgi:hypothetical protein
VALLAVKLLLSPGSVLGASLAARRFGSRVGGLIGGLPVVAGPILMVYALAHGRTFAAHAATNALLGLVSLTVFVVVYGRLAGHVSWVASLLAGWLAFAAATAVFSAMTITAVVALLLACTGLLIGAWLLPRATRYLTVAISPPWWDLPLRAGCALSLVLALTAISGQLGPQLSGLLAPFPVIASVLAAFTHSQRGVEELRRLLRGLLTGLGAFALFCFTLAVSLRAIGIVGGFLLAGASALLLQGIVLWLVGPERLGQPVSVGFD